MGACKYLLLSADAWLSPDRAQRRPLTESSWCSTSSTASPPSSSCTGSSCWLRASTRPAPSRSFTASSRPPSVDAASAEWYVQTWWLPQRGIGEGCAWISWRRAGVCVRLQFVFLTYILGVAWLGVFGFSAVPVFLFYNMWSTCATMKSSNLTNIDSICVDVRQYGKAPSPRPGKRLVLPWFTLRSSVRCFKRHLLLHVFVNQDVRPLHRKLFSVNSLHEPGLMSLCVFSNWSPTYDGYFVVQHNQLKDCTNLLYQYSPMLSLKPVKVC